jgi:hypothetical protein
MLWGDTVRLEAHGNMKDIHYGTTGEYDLKISIIPHEPVSGSVHFHIEPTLSSTTEPIEKAIITVIIRQGEDAFQSRAVNSPSSPAIYDANLTFETSGEWEVEIKISTKLNIEDKINFKLSILDSGSATSNAAGIFFLFVFSVLITGSIFLYIRYGRKPKTKIISEE